MGRTSSALARSGSRRKAAERERMKRGLPSGVSIVFACWAGGEVRDEGAGDVVRQRRQRHVVVPGALASQTGQERQGRPARAVDDDECEGSGPGLAQEGDDEVDGGGVQPLGVVDGENGGLGAQRAGDAGSQGGRGAVVEQRLEAGVQVRLDHRAEGHERSVGAEALAAGHVRADVQLCEERGDERGLADADRAIDLDDLGGLVGAAGHE